MGKHFIYEVEDKDGKKRKQDFNLDLVIRSVWKDDETLTILMKDGHEETIHMGNDKKGNEIKKRLYLSSEIDLKGNDIERYFKTIHP